MMTASLRATATQTRLWPLLQAAEASVAGQHDISRLVERMPDFGISGPGDVALHVNPGAGLSASRCQPKIGSDRLGVAEPLRFIDRRLVRQRADWTHTGNAHEALAQLVAAHDRNHHPVQ